MASTDVIICAFGPTDRTRRAVRRARSLAGGRRVQVVAADALAAETLDTRQLRADVAELRGAHGLLAALDRTRAETVLVLHDDVHLTGRSLAAMHATRSAGATLVVPHTNDEGTAHGIGALPLDGSDAQLDGARRLAGPDRPAHEVRPVCVLGRSEDVRGLVPFDVTAAGAFLQTLDDTFVVASGAVAAHANACLDRATAIDDRPLLVASMIVRDEEDMLPDCLASLEGVVDRVVVCDTGSTDRTVEIARAAGAQVIEREWRDDFAWARNEALEASRDARWVLQVDADERLVCDDPAALRRTLLAAHGEYHGFNVWLDSSDDAAGSQRTRWRFCRIFDPDVAQFQGRLHEAPHARTPGVVLRQVNLDGIELHHLGYTPEVFEAKDKAARNLAIAEAAFAAEETLHNALHLARTLELVPDGHDRAVELFETWIDRMAEGLTPSTVAYAETAFARALQRAGRLEDALAHATIACDLVPGDTAAALACAELALALGRPSEALTAARRPHQERSLSPVMRRDIVVAELTAVEAAALVRLDRAQEGFAALLPVVTDRPSAVSHWADLVDAAVDDPELVPRLVELAAHDTTGRAIREVIQRFRPADTARFCLRSAAVGCADAELIRVGAVAAMVAGSWDVFDGFLPSLTRLDADVRRDLADRLRERGQSERADAVALAVAA